MKPTSVAAAVVAIALAVSGCGAGPGPEPAAAPKVPGPPPASAATLLERFVELHLEWNASNVGSRRQRAATMTAGALRRRLLADARAAAQDTDLRALDVSRTASLEALGQRDDTWTVVVAEQERFAGRVQADQPPYRIYRARLRETAPRIVAFTEVPRPER